MVAAAAPGGIPTLFAAMAVSSLTAAAFVAKVVC